MDKSIYLDVLKMVKKGVTIEKACKSIGVNRATFYNNITNEQKNELRFYKSTTLVNNIYGHCGNKDFMSFEN